jgi:hypothetical protein
MIIRDGAEMTWNQLVAETRAIHRNRRGALDSLHDIWKRGAPSPGSIVRTRHFDERDPQPGNVVKRAVQKSSLDEWEKIYA